MSVVPTIDRRVPEVGGAGQIPELLSAESLNISGWLEQLFAVDGVGRREVESVLGAAFAANDQKFGEDAAVSWANDFQIPRALLDEHERRFLDSGSSVSAMAALSLDALRGSRMSYESIERVISGLNPEVEKLRMLVAGMPLMVAGDFVACSAVALPKLSAVYDRVAPAVDRMIFEDFIDKGLALVVRKELVVASGILFHLSLLSWTPKDGKPKGRPITNCSAGKPSLNSPYTKERCDELWGEIEHPTVLDFARMVYDFWVSSGVDWEELVLWKVDLRGAYTLLSFKPEEVPLLGAEMRGGLLVFFLCGIFGWSGTPAAFQVVTRALKWEFQRCVSGACNMYVDDVMGVSVCSLVEEDVRKVVALCNGLFNSDCVESSKTEVGRRVTVIGYDFDLDHRVVSVSRKNYLRVVYGLALVDGVKVVKVNEMQRYAQWASRYSKICVVLKPLVRALHKAYVGPMNAGRGQFKLREETRRVLCVFRALFILSLLEEKRFTRSFESFTTSPPALIVEFDASLFGGGILCFDAHGEVVGACAVDLGRLQFGEDSKFQNSAEFLISVVGLLVALKVWGRPEPLTVGFRGDSVTALRWIETESFKGDYVMNSSLAFMLICFENRVAVSGCSHIPAGSNEKADYLSRGGSVEGLRQWGLMAPEVVIPSIGDFISLCDPRINVFEDDARFIQHWRDLQRCIQRCLQRSRV